MILSNGSCSALLHKQKNTNNLPASYCILKLFLNLYLFRYFLFIGPVSKIKLSLPDFKDTWLDVIIWRRHWFRFQHTTEVSICFVILGNFEELFLRCYCFCCRCYWKNPGPWPTRPFRSVRFKILFHFYFTICKLISLRYKFLFKIFALHIKDSSN